MANNNSKAIKEKRKKDMKTATYFGTAAALLVIFATAVIIAVVHYSSNKTVLNIGNIKVKKDLYTCVYYYDSLTSSNWSQYGFDPAKSPYEQEYNYLSDGEKFDNWGKYFENLTNNTLKFLIVMTQAAEKGGYEYTSEVETHIKTELNSIEEEKGTVKNFRMYMIENYGADISKKTFENYLDLYYKANEFYKKITESKAMFNKYIGGDSESFEKTYAANKDEIDVVSFRYFYLTDNKTNAEKIEKLKKASSENEFKSLCNEFKNSEEYTKNDSSLFKDFSLKQIKTLSKGKIAKSLLAASSKSGDIFFDNTQIEDKASVEFVYLVEPRHRDDSFYNDTDIKNWEFSAMGVLLEDYSENNFKINVDEKGLEAFKDSMIVAN